MTVEACRNTLTAIAFMHGLVSDELRRRELDDHDRDLDILITVRATKPRAFTRISLCEGDRVKR